MTYSIENHRLVRTGEGGGSNLPLISMLVDPIYKVPLYIMHFRP